MRGSEFREGRVVTLFPSEHRARGSGEKGGRSKFLAGWGGVLVDATPLQEGKTRACLCVYVCACVCVCVCVCVSVCVCLCVFKNKLRREGAAGVGHWTEKIGTSLGLLVVAFGPLNISGKCSRESPQKGV